MVAIRAGAREVPVLKPADVRFGSKADIRRCLLHVRFTPKSGHSLVRAPKTDIPLIRSLVSEGNKRGRHVEAECFGSLEIDREFDPRQLHNR
jgi:hypothetical protein